PHGGPFRYRSVLIDVLGWALERVAGARLAELLSREVWRPMGAEFDADIVVDGRGNAMADGGMSATLRDLGRFGLLDSFAHLTFSDEVGVRKPAPEIFAMTLRALGVPPAEAVHVGDDPVLDVHGARAAGLRCVQVTTASLKALGAQRPDAVVTNLAGLPDAIASLERA
ncbi:MAG: HAD-IA family hydrolase, partial [Candidatus Limnocylindrales bacterium]